MYKNKKYIILFILFFLILLWFLYQNNNNNNNNILKIKDNALKFINTWDFKSAYNYYNNFINSDLNADEKMIYTVRLALTNFSEWELLNQQNIFFEKWKKILDSIREDNYLNYWEYYRVLWYWNEIIRNYEEAIKNYKIALNKTVNDEHLISVMGWISHTYMLMWNPLTAEKYILKALKINNGNVFINKLYYRNLGSLWKINESKTIWLKLIQKIDNVLDKAELYYWLSNIEFTQWNIEESLSYLDKCIDIKKDFGLCYFARAKIFYLSWVENSYNIAKNELNKAMVFDKWSSVVLELNWYLKESVWDIEGALNTHINNLNFFIDNDSNLYDSERLDLKQRLLVNIIRLYSLKKDDKALYYLKKLKEININYNNLILIEKELIKKDGWDFNYILTNSDLSDYISFWNINNPLYVEKNNCENKSSKKCFNTLLYKDIYGIIFVDKQYRKVDFDSIIRVIKIKDKCKNEKLDNSLKSICSIFTNSYDFLIKSNKKQNLKANEIFTK